MDKKTKKDIATATTKDRAKEIAAFKATLRAFEKENGLRSFPWRETNDPYKVWISELMLQQTQTSRVVPKYVAFLKRFPTVEALSRATLRDVYALWTGLGYNRRAKFLLEAATILAQEKKFPKTTEELLALPGIGPYTARAIMAFAYNTPDTFIETNIRTVFIHHFFSHQQKVDDRELAALIEQTIDIKNPRRWYWLLMDYGSFLKQSGNVTHRKSAHYAKQAPFKGSLRALRGAILRTLAGSEALSKHSIETKLAGASTDAARLENALDSLCADGMIRKIRGSYTL